MRIQRSLLIMICGAAVLAASAGVVGIQSTRAQAKRSVEFDSVLVMPVEVRGILTRACADCHSMTPHMPWYANLPPASWLIQNDIHKARKAMNLTLWSQQNGKTAGGAIGTLAAMCADVQSARMPDKKYLWMHPDAQLTPEETITFCGWTAQQMARTKPSRTTRAALR